MSDPTKEKIDYQIWENPEGLWQKIVFVPADDQGFYGAAMSVQEYLGKQNAVLNCTTDDLYKWGWRKRLYAQRSEPEK